MIFKLAYQNIVGAGLRTWLNVIVLSICYVAIIWTQGFNTGILRQASRAMIDFELGGGQYWQERYDPYDPFALEESHAVIPPALEELIQKKEAVPILIARGTIYPEGRMRPVLVRGISPEQTVLHIPTRDLQGETEGAVPALIGARMAKSADLHIGDLVTLRWRDVNGTFDADDIQIVQIMQTPDPTIDQGQVWIPLPRLQQMLQETNEATMIVLAKTTTSSPEIEGWTFRDLDYLLHDIRQLVRTRSLASGVLYLILLFLALLAIFDTQVLSIFKRRKEIGTLMALGMTRGNVVRLFTLEGTLHGVMAALLACVYGTPLILYFVRKGFGLPEITENYGIALGNRLFPTYSAALILGTSLFILIAVTIVSYFPTRRIVRLNPTEALRGKVK